MTAPNLGPLYTYAKRIGWDDATEDNLKGLQSATRRVYNVLKDNQWHSVLELQKASGVMDTTRRIRDLRQGELAYDIVCRPISGQRRTYEYRMLTEAESKGDYQH